jgi:hypothetical protein
MAAGFLHFLQPFMRPMGVTRHRVDNSMLHLVYADFEDFLHFARGLEQSELN